MEKNEIKITTDFLCDLWMAVCKEANSDDIDFDTENEYHVSLVELMAALENVLFFKLQNEIPNFTKILAIITEFGQSETTQTISHLLKAYNPVLDNVHSINKAA
ncbi:hypothetical protein [Bartonella rattimassiliensis]|uniref:Uncharacterized protein n=1 Tax=Bartonella rattimassiliensis 15908 TaxID=1094556 RepID=J0QQF7_9HYPH|nr:hypothetical protein [Bartonella rattimassiliensis]EJF85269.1 hypothetical protein MCY_01164 [Bartonella rattimassiliensis 15908]